MKAARKVGGLLLMLLAAGVMAAACRGSASETPWPVAPVNAETDPHGEDLASGNVVDTDKLPDNYNKDGGAPTADSASPPTSQVPW